MVKQIEEPRADQANLRDWHLFLYRTARQGYGSICLELTNMNGPGKPEIKAGSLLHINNCFFEVGPGNEAIPGTPETPTTPAWGGNCYIYTDVRTDGSVGFKFSNAEPVWNAAYGGWYNGGLERAVAKFFYTNSQYNGKVILDSYNAMFMANVKQDFSSPPAGVSVPIPGYVAGQPFDGDVDLPVGIYRYELKGGNGGQGGACGAFSNTISADGGAGTDGGAGESKAGTFIHHSGKIQVAVGANGGDGGQGGDSVAGSTLPYAGNGGGGGLDSRIGGITARGGKPGVGGKRTHSAFVNVMPGSPGGYGIGGNGSESLATHMSNLSDNILRPGGRGEGPKSTTSGYARLYRVG